MCLKISLKIEEKKRGRRERKKDKVKFLKAQASKKKAEKNIKGD